MPTLPRDTALPAYARRVLDALEAADYETWAVGGWVRDVLLGSGAHDVDLTTSAPWQETERVLLSAGIEVHETGTEHGTVTAVVEGLPVEVTTYRVEGSYSDSRHPDSVRFVTDVREDLARRDFTINAMAWHPARGLLDPFGGADDLVRGVIRAVGVPAERFGEDALRVLRAVRFAARLGFSVEPVTQAALVDAAPNLDRIARERVGAELDGILATGRCGWALLDETSVMCAAIPELGPLVGFEQRSQYHCYDVLVHTAHVVNAVEELAGGVTSQRLRWASLLHDIAKPRTLTVDAEGRGHFFGHPSAGAKMSDQIMRDLALPLACVRPAVALVRLHDRPMKASAPSVLRMLAELDSRVPGEAETLAFELFVLRQADALSKAEPYRGYAVELDAMVRELRAIVRSGACYRVRDLAVGGADVMEATGIAPGPEVGERLKGLLGRVMEGELPNERDALVSALRADGGGARA